MTQAGSAARAAHCEIHRRKAGTITHVRFVGVIDETFVPAAAATDLAGYTVLDCGQVEWISSFGVRKWSEFVGRPPPTVQAMYVINAPAVFADQLNMVVGFAGTAKVLSVLAPFNCVQCNEERVHKIDLQKNGELIQVTDVPPPPCPVCQSPMELADPPAEFFAFTEQQKGGKLPQDVVSFLATLEAGETSPEKEESTQAKAIVEDITWFQLKGRLGGDLSTRRLTVGVEGRVVFDLGFVTTVEPAGGLKLLEVLGRVGRTTKMCLWHVPPKVLETLASSSKPIVAPVASLALPMSCPRCGHKWSEFAAAPAYLANLKTPAQLKRKCERCGGEAQMPVLDAPLIAHLTKNAVNADLSKVEKRALNELAAAEAQQGGAEAPHAAPVGPSQPAMAAQPLSAQTEAPSGQPSALDSDLKAHKKGQRLLFAAIGLVVVAAAGAGFYLFQPKNTAVTVKATYLDRDERLYIDGLLVDPNAVKLEKRTSVALVGKNGKLLRFGTPALDGDLDVRTLAPASPAMDLSVRATVDIKTNPSGCAVAIDNKPLPTLTPTVTTIPSGAEFDFAISCRGRSVWQSKLLAIPGEYIEANVSPAQ